VHYQFRFYRDYSGGQQTNWGAHHLDIAQWGLGRDDSGASRIAGTGQFHPKGWHEVTESCRVRYEYDDGTELILGQRQDDIPKGTTFIGTEGQLHVDRGELTASRDEIIKEPLGEDEVHLTVSNNHVNDFLARVRDRGRPICDVEIGHRSATMCHLANHAIDLGRELKWDPQTERFLDDDEANALLSRPHRAPWTLRG
jgi:predicted dehydrogenase